MTITWTGDEARAKVREWLVDYAGRVWPENRGLTPTFPQHLMGILREYGTRSPAYVESAHDPLGTWPPLAPPTFYAVLIDGSEVTVTVAELEQS